MLADQRRPSCLLSVLFEAFCELYQARSFAMLAMQYSRSVAPRHLEVRPMGHDETTNWPPYE